MMPLDLQRRARLEDREDATRDRDTDLHWATPGEPLTTTQRAALRAQMLELDEEAA